MPLKTFTDGTGSALTVVLTVSGLSHAAEAVTLHDALEAFTLGCADNINKFNVVEHLYGELVTSLVLTIKSFELGQESLRFHSGLLEMTCHGLGGVLVLLLDKTQLQSLVTVGFNSLHLSDNARTYFDNSARHVLAVGTENGCHSDFLS